MKKMIAMALALTLLLSLTACSQPDAGDLMENVPAKPIEVPTDMPPGTTAAADFAVRLFQSGREDGKNTLVSPLSVLCALAMTANGADGDTRAQMEAVLGMDSDSLNGFLHSYLDSLPRAAEYKLSLANSLWYKKDSNLKIEQSFLDTLADHYGAEARKTPFDDKAKAEINDWVEEHTDGMIPQILDEISPDAVMYLINALAFDARWNTPYEEFAVGEGEFHLPDGTKRTVDLMHSEENAYLEDDLATGFLKYYHHGHYAFAALLPKEGVTVDEYIDSLTGEHLLEMLSQPQDIKVFATMPKFETESSLELSEVLANMGMPDAFDPAKADFSRMGTYHDMDRSICISQVLHKTFLSVAEQGTRAGAATIVEMVAMGALEPGESRTVTLDRPFVYMLIDTQINLPFFIGTMHDVQG